MYFSTRFCSAKLGVLLGGENSSAGLRAVPGKCVGQMAIQVGLIEHFYFCGFLNHLDFSSSFPLTLAQVFIDFSTESESPLPRLTAGVPITVSIQLWPTGSYSLCKYLSSPCEILSTTQDTWGMSRREWFQGVQCVAFFIFKRKTTDLFTFGHVGP